MLNLMIFRQSNSPKKSTESPQRNPWNQSPGFMLIREGAERHPGMHWTWWRCLLRVVICCISLRKTIFWRSGRCHVRSGNSKHQSTIKELIPGRIKAAIGSVYPNSTIRQILLGLPVGLLSVKDVIARNTLFPYYSRFSSFEKKPLRWNNSAVERPL